MPCKYDLSTSEYALMQMFWKDDREYTLAEAIAYYQSIVVEKSCLPTQFRHL